VLDSYLLVTPSFFHQNGIEPVDDHVDLNQLGERIILPSSYIGGPRGREPVSATYTALSSTPIHPDSVLHATKTTCCDLTVGSAFAKRLLSEKRPKGYPKLLNILDSGD
jgi:hypothetical protein